MLDYLKFNLQLFAEGGDGADGGATSEADEGTNAGIPGEEIPSSIPERAKETYRKAVSKVKPKEAQSQPKKTIETTTKPDHIAYSDLIKSDEYKDEHKAYMDKTIGDRLKKYKGMEESYAKAKDLLDLVAMKYGVDTNAEGFLDTLREKAEADDSYYEDYAMNHDISTDEARKLVTMERKVAKMEAEQKQQQQLAMQQQNLQRLNREIAEAQKIYPTFNMDVEWQNPNFQRLCKTGVPIITAFEVVHKDEILGRQARVMASQIQTQTAQAVASNKARPIENGLSSSAATIVEQDFSKMNLQQLRAYADEQRRKTSGR